MHSNRRNRVAKFFLRRRSQAALAALALLLLGNASTFGAPITVAGADIPDNIPAGLNFQFNVTTPGTVADVTLQLNASFFYIGDAIVKLTSPAGTSVDIINRVGRNPSAGTFAGDASDLVGNYLFSDAGANVILPAALATGNFVAIPTGTYKPSTVLDVPVTFDVFNGQPAAGTWTLNVSDNAFAWVTKLNSATLDVVVPEPASLATVAVASLVLLRPPSRRKRH